MKKMKMITIKRYIPSREDYETKKTEEELLKEVKEKHGYEPKGNSGKV